MIQGYGLHYYNFRISKIQDHLHHCDEREVLLSIMSFIILIMKITILNITFAQMILSPLCARFHF